MKKFIFMMLVVIIAFSPLGPLHVQADENKPSVDLIITTPNNIKLHSSNEDQLTTESPPDLLTFTNFDHFYGEKSRFQGTKEVLSEID